MKVVNALSNRNYPDGVVVFPAGMFHAKQNSRQSIFTVIEKELSAYLATTGKNFILCFGIDGPVDADGYVRDQYAVAVDRTGIIALGRKFYPQNGEQGHVDLAESFNLMENGKSRIFPYGNHSFYLAVSHDIFGIKEKGIENPGVTGVIDCIHCFYEKELAASEEPVFARYGFAAVSRQWKCPVFGTGIFVEHAVPVHWPTGVMWDRGEMSTRFWNYGMNPLHPEESFSVELREGRASVRVFGLE